MRHTRVRRRFQLTLIVLFVITFAIFCEAGIDAFAPQLKSLAETKLEDVFGKRFDISIGNIEGGILHPLVLNYITVKNTGGEAVFPYVEISSVKSDFKIWDMLYKKRYETLLSLQDMPMDIILSTRNKELTAFVRMEGDITSAAIKGYLNIFQTERVDFTGLFNDGVLELALKAKGGQVKIRADFTAEEGLVTEARISHLNLCGVDVVGDLLLNNKVPLGAGIPDERYPRTSPAIGQDGAGLSIAGEARFENVVLNYRPFVDMRASYRIFRDGRTQISDLDIGGELKASGTFFFREPRMISIEAVANNANLNRFLSVFCTKDAAYLTGVLNGKFLLRNRLGKSTLDARIELKNGTIAGDLDFDTLSAHLKGEGAIIRVEESRIMRRGGYFVLGGEIDVSKFGHGNMFTALKITSDDTAVMWDGLEAKRGKDAEELEMKKRMSDEVNLSFKKYVNDQRIDESSRDSDEVAVEYKLHPHESLKLEIGDGKNFFGLEHKDRF